MSKARAIRTILTLAAVAASPGAAPRASGGGPPPTYLAVTAYGAATRACVDDALPPGFCGTVSSSSGAASVAIGDLDSDGRRDVVTAIHGEVAELCLGNGQGVFTCQDIFTAQQGMTRVALGDLNRDGRPDVVLGGNPAASPQVQVCLNFDGTLFFCGHLDDLISFEPSGLAVGDIDNDGAPDLLVARWDGPSKACLNDGRGVIVVCLDLPDGLGTGDAALADLDEDGNLDAVLAVYDGQGGGQDQVCRGTGAGLFSCSDVGEPGVRHSRVAVGDVDGNGDLDLVFAESSHLSVFCPGNGLGSFPTCFPIAPEVQLHDSVALADLDGDGRAEAAFAKGLDPLRPNYLCRFLGYDPGGEPQFDCLPFDPAFTAGRDVALWTPWIFQDGFESGDASRWSSTVQ